MSALHTLHALRSHHTTQGKCGCCWNQVDKDHPSNKRTICSCGKHEPCEAARLIDDSIAEVEALHATIDRVRALLTDPIIEHHDDDHDGYIPVRRIRQALNQEA